MTCSQRRCSHYVGHVLIAELCDCTVGHSVKATMKGVDSAIKHSIENYRLTSRSKTLWRLTPKNESKIARGLAAKKQEAHLLDLVKKRDYYTKKVLELLNEAAEELNPQLIDDCDEAIYFLKKLITRNPDVLQQIGNLVLKQQHFQQDMSNKEKKLKDMANSLPNGFLNLQKLSAMTQTSKISKKEEVDKKLAEFYVLVSEQQKRLAKECEDALCRLKVPLFCGAKEGDMVQRAQILAFLQAAAARQ